MRHVPLHHNGPVCSDLGIYIRSERVLPVAVDAMAQALASEIDIREDIGMLTEL